MKSYNEMTAKELQDLREFSYHMTITSNDSREKYHWAQVLSMVMTEECGRAMRKAFANCGK